MAKGRDSGQEMVYHGGWQQRQRVRVRIWVRVCVRGHGHNGELPTIECIKRLCRGTRTRVGIENFVVLDTDDVNVIE